MPAKVCDTKEQAEHIMANNKFEGNPIFNTEKGNLKDVYWQLLFSCRHMSSMEKEEREAANE